MFRGFKTRRISKDRGQKHKICPHCKSEYFGEHDWGYRTFTNCCKTMTEERPH